MKVQLRYSFIFDPAELWAHRDLFESDLASFFKDRGMELEQVKTITGGDEIVLFINKVDTMGALEKEVSSKRKLNYLRAKKDFGGKFK